MLCAAGLWRKTSVAGNEYFVGRLGGVKILILTNRDRGKDESRPTHHLYFAEATERPGGETRGEGRGGSPSAGSRAHAPRRAERSPGCAPARPNSVPIPDDPVCDLWRG
jgi:hypothetical protein